LQAVDHSHITCPYCFLLPASPHLAAEQEGIKIDTEVINRNTRILESEYEYVFLEGAGGLMVPIHDDLLTIDFIKQQNYPLILVSSAKIGSINHSLLSLEACKKREIEVAGIIYNEFPKVNQLIENDSRKIIKKALQSLYPDAFFANIPIVNDSYSNTLNVIL
jgi:dethiobiotin synthetase